MSALVRYNAKWDRGTDLQLFFKYAVGATADTAAAPADFVSWTAQADAERVETGTQTVDTTPLVHLSTGNGIELTEDGTVYVTFPKSEVSSGGAVDALFLDENPITLKYDVMLRDVAGIQIKLVSGTIVVEDSVTVWQTV